MNTSQALAALRSERSFAPHLTVRRAWPHTNASLIAEIYNGQTELLGAAHIDAAGHVRELPYGTDAKLPELAGDLREPGSQLLVHRAGKRAVVMHSGRVSKHLKPVKVRSVVTASAAVGNLASASGFTVAEVISTGHARVDFSQVAGRSLFQLADQGLEAWSHFALNWSAFLERGSAAYRSGEALHSPQGNYRPPVHSANEEALVLEQWVGHTEAYNAFSGLSDRSIGGAELSAAAQRVAHELRSTEIHSDYVLLHRDLHDKQLLWDGTSLGIIDLDTAAYGEAALDVGNLLAHVELRATQGIYSRAFSAHIIKNLEQLAAKCAIPETRLELYRQAARVRIACVYSFRPSAQRWLPSWIKHTLTPIH